MVLPQDPEIAGDAGVQGQGKVSAKVHPTGSPILKQQQAENPRDAAAANIQKWKFHPCDVGQRRLERVLPLRPTVKR